MTLIHMRTRLCNQPTFCSDKASIENRLATHNYMQTPSPHPNQFTVASSLLLLMASLVSFLKLEPSCVTCNP